MKRFWWIVVMLGTLASSTLLIFSISEEIGLKAIQEPTTFVAFVLALSILPYIWARAIEGWGLRQNISQ